LIVLQLYTGYIFLKKSSIGEEQNFMATLLHKQPQITQEESMDIANYINSLPNSSQVLVDDAVAYPIVAYVNNMKMLTMPYQESYLSAIESPDKYDNYMLISNDTNPANGYTQLNGSYLDILKKTGHAVNMEKIYRTDNWSLYRIR
jgi:hypothetical protein